MTGTIAERNYSRKRPKITWREHEKDKDAIEVVRSRLELSGQQFIDRLFQIGFPVLLEEAGLDRDDSNPTHQLLLSQLTETLELVTEELRVTQANSPLVAQADAVMGLARDALV